MIELIGRLQAGNRAVAAARETKTRFDSSWPWFENVGFLQLHFYKEELP